MMSRSPSDREPGKGHGDGTSPPSTGVVYEQALAAGRAVPAGPYDPLRLCVYTTVALLTWLLGAWAVLAFALLGLSGYWRARRAGLTRSRCYLRDTRLVLAYLGVIAVAAAVAAIAGLFPG